MVSGVPHYTEKRRGRDLSKSGRHVAKTDVTRVSIGMPVYNGEQYVAQALDCLLAQTYDDFELVIGDNGSTDGTLEICRAYAERDPRIRVLESAENRGAAWNYNRVFRASRGRYFRWAAHDDLVAPEYLACLVAALDEAPATTVLAQTGTVLIDADGNEIGVWEEGFDLASPSAPRRLSQLVRHLIMSNVLFGLTRRSTLERTRLHGSYPSADYVLIAELVLAGAFVLLPETLFMRRVHPGMSRVAHTNLDDVADWFEPGSSRGVRPEKLTLFTEHLQAIRRSPLNRRDQAVAVGAFLPIWLARHKRAMAMEVWASAHRVMGNRRPR
jgi:glycosyltransferase involved in cell wall biosynthesis